MNEDKTIKVRIEVNKRVKVFEADYHTLHNNDWDYEIRDLLDDEYFDPEKDNLEVNI